MPANQTPRDHGLSIGGVDGSKISQPPASPPDGASRQVDPAYKISESERHLGKLTPPAPPKPYR